MTTVGGTGSSFKVVCEVRPPTRPDLDEVRREIELFARFSEHFVVPENALGVATVSSISVAQEIITRGGQPTVCLNARDRSYLGFRRDLLTATAAGAHEFLFVQGDRVVDIPPTGLTVRSMIDAFCSFRDEVGRPDLTFAVSSRIEPLVEWKRAADRLFVQASFSLDALLRWRDALAFEGPVFAGVIVPPSARRARLWNEKLTGVTVPDAWIEALDKDALAGVDLAGELADSIETSGAFEGIHLIAGVRQEETAAYLSRRLADRGPQNDGAPASLASPR